MIGFPAPLPKKIATPINAKTTRRTLAASTQATCRSHLHFRLRVSLVISRFRSKISPRATAPGFPSASDLPARLCLAAPRLPGCSRETHPVTVVPGCELWREARSEEHTSELQSRLHLVC